MFRHRGLVQSPWTGKVSSLLSTCRPIYGHQCLCFGGTLWGRNHSLPIYPCHSSVKKVIRVKVRQATCSREGHASCIAYRARLIPSAPGLPAEGRGMLEAWWLEDWKHIQVSQDGDWGPWGICVSTGSQEFFARALVTLYLKSA